MHSWQSLVVYLIDYLIDRVFRGSISPKKDERLILFLLWRKYQTGTWTNYWSVFKSEFAESNWFEGARSWNDCIVIIYCQCQASTIFIISKKPFRVSSRKAWKTTERTRSEVDEVYSPLNGGSLLEWHIPFRGKAFLTQPPNVVVKIWLLVEPFLELNKIKATIIEPIW